MTLSLSQVSLSFGKVVAFEDMTDNSIALDGYVQGPQVDPARRRFSFDHHAGCLRMVTKATCEQVREAICLGLPVDETTEILVNDLDADTVLSVWFLLNPNRVWEERMVSLCAQIGRTDAHGPLFMAHPIHRQLSPAPAWHPEYRPQSVEMLEGFLLLLDRFAAGEWTAPPVKEGPPSKGFGWNVRDGWVPLEVVGFDGFYSAGAVLGFLYEKNLDGTYSYTVAKASDLVAADLGPGSKVRPMAGPDDCEPTVLGALARAEWEKNPNQRWSSTWGGGSSIGGGPRNRDGSGSCLTPDEVLAVFKPFAPGFVTSVG